MIVSRRRKGLKSWRLSYYKWKSGGKVAPFATQSVGAASHHFHSFFTVKEALEHVRLMGLTFFRLEDHVEPLNKVH
jgi:branched-subunit amino acid aminotransferase/4-amino-4-deoxychorismate lyase